MKVGATILLVFAWACVVQVKSLQANEPKIFCYFASWTVYRPGNGKFDVQDIDPFLCTHVAFAFVGLQNNGSIRIVDPWESGVKGLDGLNRLANLKMKNEKLKILVSMGGWNEMASGFSEVAANAAKRATLTTEIVAFIQKHKFDGLDFDWQYPSRRDSTSKEDKENHILLLQELKNAFEPLNYVLTVAVSGAKNTTDVSYDIASISKIVDHINIMAFDFHGSFDGYVGHHTLLHSAEVDSQHNNAEWNINDSVTYWIDQGTNPEKLNLGLATYGRTFTLKNASNHALYAPITGGGAKGPYTKIDGVLGYNEICELHSSDPDVFNKDQQVYHKVIGDQWIGYENKDSIKIKVEYALSKNLGGFMIWSLDTDDFANKCGDGKYPLINTVKTTAANYYKKQH